MKILESRAATRKLETQQFDKEDELRELQELLIEENS
jgi:Arc/MetJ-type ribon-helix-helix transcriptional regulator